MPSLTYFQTALVGNKTAKIGFTRSEECKDCIRSLLEPGDKSKPLAILALASREPEAAAALRQMVDFTVLEGLLVDYRTPVLRLLASLGAYPSSAILSFISALLNTEYPSIDDITASQFAASILKNNFLSVECVPNPMVPSIFLAAQVTAADERLVDSKLLWTLIKSQNKQLRLSVAWKLARLGKCSKCNILPYLVELIPDPEACDVAATVVSQDVVGARELAQHSSFKKLLSSESTVTPHVLNLCAAIAQTDELRMALVSQGAIGIIMARKDAASLGLLLSLTRSVKCLRSGAGTSEVAQLVFQCLEHDDETKYQAMAVACNLVIETSPVSGLVLEKVLNIALEGASSTHHMMKLNSVCFLRNATFNKSIQSVKADIMGGLGVQKLLGLCDCKDQLIENAALGFLRNYLAFNDDGVDLWVSMCPVDLWSLIECKLISVDSVVNALYILVHIAASTVAHKKAILERPNLLRRVATVLDETDDEKVLVAGVWLLGNLYHKTENPTGIELFEKSLQKCKKYHITIRIKAESLLQTVEESRN